ncbi:MAG TPA: NIPSNAP family protein [Acidobacteriota bacterium]|nr:NIPSNAP family protein [Acidobacteriota bacterium]HRR25233.1 NIPSNAP family protein [Acidobacteriota bacterium]HRR55355.1 NIPSNAP family protein [Acidobacteriota bacterium]
MAEEVLLRVTYTVPVHHAARFEHLLTKRVLPIAHRLGISCRGVWRTVVGDAGEYMELWAFSNLAEFEERWRRLLQDPEIQEIFQETGPMVQHERFTLLEPLPAQGLSAGDIARI